MKDLNNQLKTLCRQNRGGSFGTQDGRRHMLDQTATELHDLGAIGGCGLRRSSRSMSPPWSPAGASRASAPERYLAHRLNEIRRAAVYGIRPTRTFQQAAIKYLHDYQHKKSLERDVYAFNRMPHVGDLSLDRIHNDTLAQYRQARRADGVTAGTINKELSYIRRILNLAARVWRQQRHVVAELTAADRDGAGCGA